MTGYSDALTDYVFRKHRELFVFPIVAIVVKVCLPSP
jgi:hypothetical protein